MTPIVFLDTETTSLRHDRRVWEVGLIRRDDSGETEYREFIDWPDLDLGNADLYSLKIGTFYDRHPQGDRASGQWVMPPTELDVLLRVEELTRGAHLVGNVVSFDAEVLANRMRANGICPSWHYHIIDIESMAVGYLEGLDHVSLELPWDSERLSDLLGVEPPAENERHTALGDARWVMRMWHAITGGRP